GLRDCRVHGEALAPGLPKRGRSSSCARMGTFCSRSKSLERRHPWVALTRAHLARRVSPPSAETFGRQRLGFQCGASLRRTACSIVARAHAESGGKLVVPRSWVALLLGPDCQYTRL